MIQSVLLHGISLRVGQYFRCLMGSPLTAILRRLLSMSSRIWSLRFSIARACSSWSMYISSSSSSSRLTCSYSWMSASTLSSSALTCLLRSIPTKCSLRSFSSSAMMLSSSTSWARMLASTPASRFDSSLPLATSLARFPAWFPASALLRSACCSRLLWVIFSSSMLLRSPPSLFSARLASSFFCLSSATSLMLSPSAWCRVLSSRALVDSLLRTCFSSPFSLAMLASSRESRSSHWSSSFLRSSLRALMEVAMSLFSWWARSFLFSRPLISQRTLWISAARASAMRFIPVFSRISSSISMLAFCSWVRRASISSFRSMMLFLSISILTRCSFSHRSFSSSSSEYFSYSPMMSSSSLRKSPSSCLSSQTSLLRWAMRMSFWSLSAWAAWWALTAASEQSRYLLYITNTIQQQFIWDQNDSFVICGPLLEQQLQPIFYSRVLELFLLVPHPRPIQQFTAEGAQLGLSLCDIDSLREPCPAVQPTGLFADNYSTYIQFPFALLLLVWQFLHQVEVGSAVFELIGYISFFLIYYDLESFPEHRLHLHPPQLAYSFQQVYAFLYSRTLLPFTHLQDDIVDIYWNKPSKQSLALDSQNIPKPYLIRTAQAQRAFAEGQIETPRFSPQTASREFLLGHILFVKVLEGPGSREHIFVFVDHAVPTEIL